PGRRRTPGDSGAVEEVTGSPLWLRFVLYKKGRAPATALCLCPGLRLRLSFAVYAPFTDVNSPLTAVLQTRHDSACSELWFQGRTPVAVHHASTNCLEL